MRRLIAALLSGLALAGPAAHGAGDSKLVMSTHIDGHRAALAHDPHLLPDGEAALLGALQALRAGDIEVAIESARAVAESQPDFRLAQLIYADMLLARAGMLSGFGASSGAPDDKLEPLRAEARQRFGHRLAIGGLAGRTPAALLAMAPSQRQAIVVDVSESRLYVFRNEGGTPRLDRSYYVSTGKNGPDKRREGDQRTPVGVYFLTGRIRPDKLSDFYGAGALPMNYPNEWDRRHGRTGYGIWIHGVPSSTYARAPRASDGCMALSNTHLAALWKSVDATNTPVIIADRVDWDSARVVRERATGLLDRLEAWRRAWESLDIRQYSAFYSREFHSEDHGYRSWMKRKHRVARRKQFIRIGISDLSMFGYPGEKDMAVVTFDQRYRSDSFHNRLRKRQYWRREADGAWRIVYEGVVKLRDEHLRGIPFSARQSMVKLTQ